MPSKTSSLPSPQDDRYPEAVLHLIHRAADSRQVHDAVALDLRYLTPFTDYFYIGHSHSRPQSDAIVDAVVKALDKSGVKGYHVEGTEAGEWVLLDTGDVVAHIFLTRERRDFYNLEGLWADAGRADLPEEEPEPTAASSGETSSSASQQGRPADPPEPDHEAGGAGEEE